MADDYYKTLGLKRDASSDEIQKAYRDLARKHHPDLHPDDKTAKEKFQKVQAAFEVLNDPKKREMYDRYGSSFEAYSGAGGAGPRPQRGGRGPTGGPPGYEEVDFGELFGNRSTAGGGDPSSLFGDIFGQFNRASGGRRGGRARSSPAPSGGDIQQEIEIPFQTSVHGGNVDLRLQREDGQGESISVKIPTGVEDGKKIRLRGQGVSRGGGPPGDLLLRIKVAPHPFFQRRGNNLEVRVPVTLVEATLGAKVDVPTPKGTISLRVPPMTSSGKKLRIKGHGVETADGKKGDLLADIQIVLPEKLDDPTIEAIKASTAEYKRNPREELRW